MKWEKEQDRKCKLIKEYKEKIDIKRRICVQID